MSDVVATIGAPTVPSGALSGQSKLALLVVGVGAAFWFVWKKFGLMPAIGLLVLAWLKWGWTGD